MLGLLVFIVAVADLYPRGDGTGRDQREKEQTVKLQCGCDCECLRVYKVSLFWLINTMVVLGSSEALTEPHAVVKRH